MKIRWSGILPVAITGVLFGLWQGSIVAALFMIWVLLSLAAFFAWHAEALASTTQRMWEEHAKSSKRFLDRAADEEMAASLSDSTMSWGRLQEENPEEFRRLWANRKTPAELADSMEGFHPKSK